MEIMIRSLGMWFSIPNDLETLLISSLNCVSSPKQMCLSMQCALGQKLVGSSFIYECWECFSLFKGYRLFEHLNWLFSFWHKYVVFLQLRVRWTRRQLKEFSGGQLIRRKQHEHGSEVCCLLSSPTPLPASHGGASESGAEAVHAEGAPLVLLCQQPRVGIERELRHRVIRPHHRPPSLLPAPVFHLVKKLRHHLLDIGFG